jgi:hypothetical protein
LKPVDQFLGDREPRSGATRYDRNAESFLAAVCFSPPSSAVGYEWGAEKAWPFCNTKLKV